MVDHVSQLPSVSALFEESKVPPSVFLKIDMGGHRAGVEPLSASCKDLITALLALSTSSTPICHFLGLYSHAGQSYASNSSAAAMDYLRQELDALVVTAKAVHAAAPSPIPSPLLLSVGATPSATSMRNLLLADTDVPDAEAKAAAALRATFSTIADIGCEVEVHAGVYPTLDIQQLATHALPMDGPNAMLTWNKLALTVVAEVASLYPGRGKHGTPEALIGAGCFALGREPCKAYSGWGMLTPWNRPGVAMPDSAAEAFKGWTVGRISQEHGILTFNGSPGGVDEKLEVGQKVRIWPNHACITSGNYAFYLVVDEGRVGKEDEIVDVWVRCRGW
jgi:D-serine deaminase-like pyridoxal phosphate-dependent protein